MSNNENRIQPKAASGRLSVPQTQKRTPHIPRSQKDILGGVTVQFLSEIFRMKAATVRRRLAECEVRRYEGQSAIYDLPEAAAYLIDPKVDLREFFRTLRPEELPAQLQKDVWDAQLKRQKWMENAGELWHTTDIVETLGEMFKTIKSTVQLWQDNIDQIDQLTDKQREALSQSCDGLLHRIHESLIEAGVGQQYGNQSQQVSENGLPIPRQDSEVE